MAFTMMIIIDLIEICTQTKHYGKIQLVNNSDRRNSNISEYIKSRKKERKYGVFASKNIIQDHNDKN